MEFSDLITRLPLADVPFPGVDGYMARAPEGLVVFFHFKDETIVPPHSHGAQWGAVLAGEVELTLSGVTQVRRPGDSYSIGEGEVHSARVAAGTRLVEFFEEPDRYTPRQA
jgi:quercetin dioxygenase-like cupin family protein